MHGIVGSFVHGGLLGHRQQYAEDGSRPGFCRRHLQSATMRLHDALRQRLTGRQTDSPEVIARRLAEARGDMSHWSEFDYVVVNETGQVERTAEAIEAKLAASPPVKPTTSAPAPITPVTARTSGNPSYDTTDPRSTKTMSTSEWIEAERARQLRKMQAQMNR